MKKKIYDNKCMQEVLIKDIFKTLKSGGRQRGIELLYRHYYNKMYGIAFSVLKDENKSEDAVHNVIYKLLMMNENLFPQSGENIWLYNVVKNEALLILRKEKKVIPFDEIKEIVGDDKDIEEYVDLDVFYSMIATLNEERKEIVTLKVLCGYSHKEIAEMLNKKIGTIQWLYNTSVKKLKILLTSFISIISIVFSALLVESVFYWQNLSIVNNSTTNQAGNFYIDYILLVLCILFFLLIFAFIIFFKKSEKIPTKAGRKNI